MRGACFCILRGFVCSVVLGRSFVFRVVRVVFVSFVCVWGRTMSFDVVCGLLCDVLLFDGFFDVGEVLRGCEVGVVSCVFC